MSLTYQFINPLIQFGTKQFDFLILNGDECVFRTQKTFSENVTDAELAEYANERIAILVKLSHLPFAL